MSRIYFFCTWFRSWSHLCSFKYLRLWAVESILKIYLIIFNFRYIVCCWSILPNNVLSITNSVINISILTSTCLRTYFRLNLLSCIRCIIFILIRFSLFMVRWKRVLHFKKIFGAMLLSQYILLNPIYSNRRCINCASYFLNLLIEHIFIGPGLIDICIKLLLTDSSIISNWSVHAPLTFISWKILIFIYLLGKTLRISFLNWLFIKLLSKLIFFLLITH
jgi:hypothetical protein